MFHILESNTVDIFGLTVQNGFAGTGGGIFNSGALTITDSAVSGNETTGGCCVEEGGGGIFSDGELIVIGTTISENTAQSIGGGISSGG